MLAGVLIWEFGSRTMSLTPEFAEKLALASPDPQAVDITDYRDQIVSPDKDVVYERLARSFQTTEPVVNLYTLRLANGGTAQVRSQSRWELNERGTPARLISVIDQIDGFPHNELEDELIEKLIELRFLAERHGEPVYRNLVDEMMRVAWNRRRPD